MRRALALVFVVAGCYAPKIDDGAFQCVAPDNLCPSGFSCIAGHCYRSAVTLDLSMGTFVGDGSAGALMLDDTATGTLTFNPDSGEVRFTATGMTSPMVLFMPGQAGFVHLTQPSGGPPIGLWNFTTVNIPAGVSVTPAGTGANLLGLAASTTMVVRGNVDWRGYGGAGGLPHMAGGSRMSGVTSAGGAGGDDASGAGGGGAGYSAAGAMGGGTAGGMGGMAYGTDDLTPVHAGSGGGGGGGQTGAMPGSGGLGGGAVVLTGHDVTLGAKIDVSGNAGTSADAASTAAAGGGGGGSGGSILVNADSLTLESNHSLVARGGLHGDGAAGGNPGGDGADGRIALFYGTLNFTGSASTIVSTPAARKTLSTLTTFPR